MKYLSIDYGQKRTGLAVSDPEGAFVFPRCTLHKTTRERFFAELLAVIEAEAPDALVVGLPVNLQGDDTLTTVQTRNMVNSLKRRVALPVFWMPEILSSHEAEADLHEAGLRGAARKAVLDQQAAVRILESFLAQSETQRSPA